MNWTRIHEQLGKRGAIVVAGAAGFLVGAGGFVAAQIDDSPSAAVDASASTTATTPSTATDSTATVAGSASTTATTRSTATDSTATVAGSASTTATTRSTVTSLAPTTIDLTIPVDTIDDSATSAPDTSAPDTSTDDTSVPVTTIDDHGDDDSTSVPDTTVPDTTVPDTTVPDTTVPDTTGPDDSSVPDTTIDDSTSSSVPPALPAPFSRSYQSAGGSIEVTWTGTAFVLASVSPAPGFAAEIEDQAWDRIRVDFEADEGDARIEVRLNDGQIRVRVD